MKDQTSTGIMVAVFGLLFFLMGLYGYVGRGAPRFFRVVRWRINWFYGLLPFGFAFSVMGLGILVSRHPWTDVLLLLGFAVLLPALILPIWHPRPLRPWWLKNGPTWF